MEAATQPENRPRAFGRYLLFSEIAVGGMATVHLGRLIGPVGFSRTVAIKRLHPQFAKDPEFVGMFLDEARVAARIQHPNVVGSLDVIAEEHEVLLVMDYIQGETLSRLLRLSAKDNATPYPAVIVRVLVDALYGLHAAHIATSENGEPLNIVHRDVSPQNILVGVDGVARVLDFGVALAAMRSQTTSQGQVKGKLAYMAPEQLQGTAVDRRADIFAAGVVLWEALAMRRLFQTDDLGELVRRLMSAQIPPPSRFNPEVSPELDRVVLRALNRDPSQRYHSARAFAAALEASIDAAPPSAVGEWVNRSAAESLAQRAKLLAEIEVTSAHALPPKSSVGPRTLPSRPAEAAAPAEAAPERRSRRPWLWAVMGAALPSAALLLWMRPDGEAPPPKLEQQTVAPSPARPAPPAPPPAAAAPLAQESDVPKAARAPAAVTSAPEPEAPEASADQAEPPRPSATVRRSTPSKPRPQARKDCDPPYRVDENGIRRIRPECL